MNFQIEKMNETKKMTKNADRAKKKLIFTPKAL